MNIKKLYYHYMKDNSSSSVERFRKIIFTWMGNIILNRITKEDMLILLYKLDYMLYIKLKNTLLQFVRFGIVGLSNTILGYMIYISTLALMRSIQLWPSLDIYIAQFVMFVLSVAWSFYWNKRFVFKLVIDGEHKFFIALLKTYVTYAFTSLFLAEFLLYLWVDILKINEFIAPIVTLLITVPLNFVIQKFWDFG